jgi:type II secretory ATPase GspE/PulE/Tfp pilus assembly ATPase PilB-like protein
LLSDRIQFDKDILTMDRFLRAALFQYLIGVLCPDCKKPATSHMTADRRRLLVEKFGLDPVKLYVRNNHAGQGPCCATCKGSGVIERTTALEVVVPTRSMLRSIAISDFATAELEYRKQRVAKFTEPGTTGKTYVEHALYKASLGDVCANALFDMENLWTYETVPVACDDISSQANLTKEGV